jgi:hypothetical protein
LKLFELSYALRSKSEWWVKYKDDTRKKWKQEALETEFSDGNRLTEDEVEWVLDELRGYEKLRNHEKGVQVSNAGIRSALL